MSPEKKYVQRKLKIWKKMNQKNTVIAWLPNFNKQFVYGFSFQNNKKLHFLAAEGQTPPPP